MRFNHGRLAAFGHPRAIAEFVVAYGVLTQAITAGCIAAKQNLVPEALFQDRYRRPMGFAKAVEIFAPTP